MVVLRYRRETEMPKLKLPNWAVAVGGNRRMLIAMAIEIAVINK